MGVSLFVDHEMKSGANARFVVLGHFGYNDDGHFLTVLELQHQAASPRNKSRKD